MNFHPCIYQSSQNSETFPSPFSKITHLVTKEEKKTPQHLQYNCAIILLLLGTCGQIYEYCANTFEIQISPEIFTNECVLQSNQGNFATLSVI